MTNRLSRKARKFLRRIQKSRSLQELQLIANDIQTEVDSRNINYEEANQLGNRIQERADLVDSNGLIYAISDRDTYRRTLEIYLKMSLLKQNKCFFGMNEENLELLKMNTPFIDKLVSLYRVKAEQSDSEIRR